MNVKWQQSLRITAKRLLSLALKDTGNGKENWALYIRGQKGKAALGGLRELHHPSLPWHRGKELLPGGTLEDSESTDFLGLCLITKKINK